MTDMQMIAGEKADPISQKDFDEMAEADTFEDEYSPEEQDLISRTRAYSQRLQRLSGDLGVEEDDLGLDQIEEAMSKLRRISEIASGVGFYELGEIVVEKIYMNGVPTSRMRIPLSYGPRSMQVSLYPRFRDQIDLIDKLSRDKYNDEQALRAAREDLDSLFQEYGEIVAPNNFKEAVKVVMYKLFGKNSSKVGDALKEARQELNYLEQRVDSLGKVLAQLETESIDVLIDRAKKKAEEFEPIRISAIEERQKILDQFPLGFERTRKLAERFKK